MNFIHWHLALNQVPLIGVAFSLALLQWGVYRRQADVERAALWSLLGCAVFGAGAYLTGEGAAQLAPRILGASQALIERHERAAIPAGASLAVLAAVSAWGLWDARLLEFPRRRVLAFAAMAALACLLLLARTAYRGGQIRHSEIQPDWKEMGAKP